MEIKEHGTTKLLEATSTKLNAAEIILKESKCFLENVNNLNVEDEEEKEKSSSVDVSSFLTSKQRRTWKNLSMSRKKHYLAKTTRTTGNHRRYEPQNTNLKIAEEKAGAEKKLIGKQNAQKEVMQKGASKSAKTGVGSAATGGVYLAGEAAKKTAEKFKESLSSRAMEQVEHFQQIEGETKGKKKRTTETYRYTESGSSFTLITGLFLGIMICIILPVVVALAIVGAVGSSEDRSLVEVARAELETAEYNIGGTTYKEWYGLDDDWCAMFVSWCANECGYIADGIMVKSASVSETKNWYEERNLYQAKENGYVPAEGDLVFFLNGMSHVGIVVSYQTESDQIVVIEGNSGTSLTTPYHVGSRVTQNIYERTAESISGYGTLVNPETQENTNEQIEQGETRYGTGN